MQGNQIVARALAQQDLKICFGIVGVPVIELGYALQAEGISYYGCRNEQGASYSAQAVGYLTGKPGICLCVSGPGLVHALAGIVNAWSNAWPMVVIAGASDIAQDGRGSFQECNQLSLTLPYCKYSYRISNPLHIPFHVQKAVRLSVQGRAGPVYLELPGDVLSAQVEESLIAWAPRFKEIALGQASSAAVQLAAKVLREAKRPLIIIGKGAAYARAESEVRQLIELTQLPFLATPLGKGVVDDEHALSVAPARSTALGQADVILLLGARLNWILHYGLQPRFAKDVKVIQVDVCPEEFDTNVLAAVNLLGDCKLVVRQLIQEL